MSTPPADFQRARRPEHKELRAASILNAARTLGLAKGVRAVTLTDIANEAGINKSAVLRYYETREEIYLRLTAEGWTAWSTRVRAALGAAGERSAETLADVLATTVLGQPLFCDLLAHATLNLERHVSREAVLSFKLRVLGSIADLTRAVADFEPRLGEAGARDVVSGVTLLAGGLWQASHPPSTLAELYTERPDLGHAVVDLPDKLNSLVRALITGLSAPGSTAH
ncbi:TetR/AcrR family transcriptional regulator [Streptomyces sp. NBC_01497]|uniref:TetR/AcrR family transcriptional regulator n=1 Tax=Streptomyces sp. NBC_01497 TaxID=2903885 RepID=UPI002E365B4A|nr:TetR family transcriptional regulator [Streptomyces sp. NBC_01497]